MDEGELDEENLLNYSRNRFRIVNSHSGEMRKGSSIELEKNLQSGDFYIMSKFNKKGVDKELSFSTVKFNKLTINRVWINSI